MTDIKENSGQSLSPRVSGEPAFGLGLHKFSTNGIRRRRFTGISWDECTVLASVPSNLLERDLWLWSAHRGWPCWCDKAWICEYLLVWLRNVFSIFIHLSQDFWSVYHHKLSFLGSVNMDDIHIRTSTEPRTMQVASGILYGMDPKTISQAWKVVTQPLSVGWFLR